MTTAIIDISAVYWRAWHASEGEDVSSAKRRTIAIVDDVARRHDEVIVAIDSPPYLRKSVYADYKAQREERSAASIEELRLAIEACRDAGYTIASAEGWEADDVIGTLCTRGGIDAVYGSDKDLLQVCDLIDPFTGSMKTAWDKLGVREEQVPDYLALIGDSSDNIPGVKGVGPKTAVALLSTFGNLDGIMAAIKATPEKFKPSTLAAFEAAWDFLPTAISLTTLSTNLDIKMETKKMEHKDAIQPPASDPINDPIDADFEEIAPPPEPTRTTAIVRETVGIRPYRAELEPSSMEAAWKVANKLFQSRLYPAYANVEAVFATLMRGRALGLDATTSLDSINVIKGKPTMSAALMVGLVRGSGVCEYFDCIDSDATSCTWVTKRAGAKHESKRTFTMDEARSMDLANRDNWKKQPAVMLQWRAAAALCRMVYSDVINGLYAREEMED